NMAAEVGYVGNKATRTQHSSNYNVPEPGPGNIQARRTYPAWGVLDSRFGAGHRPTTVFRQNWKSDLPMAIPFLRPMRGRSAWTDQAASKAVLPFTHWMT